MKITATLANFFMPELCPHCRQDFIHHPAPLCQTCLQKLNEQIFTGWQVCRVCGSPDRQDECSHREMFFSGSAFVWHYRDQARTLMSLAKFKNRANSRNYLFAGALARLSSQESDQPTVLLPLVSSRQFLADFAGRLSQKNNWPLIQPFYKKSGQTENKKLQQTRRFGTINQVLAVKASLLARIQPAARIVLLDDIWTSGATLNQAARLLCEQGIERSRIQVLALMRTDRQSPVNA